MNDIGIMPAGIGHNSAPLGEMLAEETATLVARAAELVAAAGRCHVTDDDTAGRATTLAGMMKKHLAEIDSAREIRKRPFLEAGRTVDAHFGGIAGTLATLDSRNKVVGGPMASVLSMVDSYRREQEAKATAERKRIEDEARKLREEAAAAERARIAAEDARRREREEADRRVREAEEAARRAGDAEAAAKAAQERAEADAKRRQEEAADAQRRLDDEIARNKAAVEAEALERQAAATRAAPVTGIGAKAFGRTVWSAKITDLTAAIKHCRRIDEQTLRTAVQSIYDRQVRAGVRELPGAEVSQDTTTSIRSA